MSSVNSGVTNEQVIPVIESDLFAGHEESRFAIGIIAVGDNIVNGFEKETAAYYQLRGNVYHAQTGMISADEIHEDGGDWNPDDSRSVHIATFEQGAKAGLVRNVSTMRLIVKTAEADTPLPVEDFFPEAFKDRPAPGGASEVSRYINRHENARIQRMLSDPLFSAALAYIMTNELGPTYAVVEPFLEADLAAKGVPFERIAAPRFVPEYAADNLGLKVDTDAHARVMEVKSPGIIDTMRAAQGKFTYFGRHRATILGTGAVA